LWWRSPLPSFLQNNATNSAGSQLIYLGCQMRLILLWWFAWYNRVNLVALDRHQEGTSLQLR
jgi:hypothetical protein